MVESHTMRVLSSFPNLKSIKSGVATIALSLGLVSVIGPSAAMAQDMVQQAPIKWRLSTMLIQTTTIPKPFWYSIRCTMIQDSSRFYFAPGTVEKTTLVSRDNNCLHLVAANLTLEIVNSESSAQGSRYFDVRIVRHDVASSLRTSELPGGLAEYEAVKEQKRRLGQEPIVFDEGFLTAKDRVYFGHRVSDDVVRVECRQYVQTVAGFVNPVGLRSLECRSLSDEPIRVRLNFSDTSAWIR